MRLKGLVHLLAWGTICATAGAATADALDAMQGAWVEPGVDCAGTFAGTGKDIHFSDSPTNVRTGIIVSGKTITGPNGTCTVEKVHQEKDHVTLLMSCADAVMFSTISASFKPIDATHFDRIDTDFPELTVSYTKCSL